MKAVIFGTGSREASIGEALAENGYEVFGVATGSNNYPLNVPGAEMLGSISSSKGRPLDMVAPIKPELVVIQQEQLLFNGLANALRGAGLTVIGASRHSSMLEYEKGRTRFTVGQEFPNNVPKQLETDSAHDWLTQNTATKCVAQTKTVIGPQTTVLVTDEPSRQKALLLADRHDVTIEEFIEGMGVTFYAFTNGRDTALSDPMQTYPFRLDGENGDKTGGMGASTVSGVEPERLLKAKSLAMDIARHLVSTNVRAGDYLQCFSVELILGKYDVTYVESDARLGDPENCLLTELIGRNKFGETLIALADNELLLPSVKYTAGVGIVVAPTDYPSTQSPHMLSSDWLDELSASKGHMYLGNVRRSAAGTILTGMSRTAVYVTTGSDLSIARTEAYEELEKSAIPDQLAYRTDVGKPSNV